MKFCGTKIIKQLLIGIVLVVIVSCKQDAAPTGPNVILIMIDDIGYECLSAYGNTSYDTPVLDSLAEKGLTFSHCISQPLCSPSRLKIMTGLYNYRNYENFGYLNPSQFTFGNLMQDAGYETCISGKWQLNGLKDRGNTDIVNDYSVVEGFGFEEYCLWRLTQGGSSRYDAPIIETNGEKYQADKGTYGPDVFSDFIVDFIEEKKEERFFVYYPMVLVHQPFLPTPDSNEAIAEDPRLQEDTTYFKEMVTYTDKVIGKIIGKLKELELDQNTIIIITGDNGTDRSVFSMTENGLVQGGKGMPTAAGTRVPLIVYWPEKIKSGRRYNGVVEFSDFLPTLADLVGEQVESDGKSFYPALTDTTYESRKTAFVHFIPKKAKDANQYRHQFVQTVKYKLYRTGRFYNLQDDVFEKHPLNIDSLNAEEIETLRLLQEELNKHPDLKVRKKKK